MLALFDLDNTLIDRQAMFARWANGMLERLEIAPVDHLAWLTEVDGNGYGDKAQWMPLAADRFGVPESAIATDRERHWVASLELDPTVGPALDRLIEAGWTLGMVSNGPPTQWDKIEAVELAGYFEAVVVSEVVGIAKPDPGIFELAAELCGHPLDGWMVGDHPHFDVAGGQAVGLSGAWVRGSGQNQRGSAAWPDDLAPPDLTIDSIEGFVNAAIA